MSSLSKYMSATQAGAPQITNVNGQLLSMLETCLTTGYNITAPTGLSHSSGIATLTFGTSHGYEVGQVIKIAGAGQSDYNQEFRVATVPTSNTLTFVLPTSPVTPATGTLSCRVAPLDWELMFTATNKAAYRSKDLASTRKVLFLDQTPHTGYAAGQGTRARVSIYGDMLDINTPVTDYTYSRHKYPQNPDGSLFWYQKRYASKTTTVTATVIDWVLVGDGKTFYLCISNIDNGTTPYLVRRAVYAFGDIHPYYPNEEFACLLECSESANDGISYVWPSQPKTFPQIGNSNLGSYMIRPFLGSGFDMQAVRYASFTATSTTLYSGYNTGIAYPNQASGGMLMFPIHIRSGSTIRGEMRGLLCIATDLYAAAQTDGTGVSMFDKQIVDTLVQGQPAKVLVLSADGTTAQGSGYFGVLLSNWG